MSSRRLCSTGIAVAAFTGFVGALWWALPAAEPAAAQAGKSADAVKPAPAKRVLWTQSKVAGSPEPPAPYAVERVFPKLKFDRPLDMQRAPGSDRLFIVEHGGVIHSFPNRNDVEKTDVLLDLRPVDGKTKKRRDTEVWGLAFHPRFAANGTFFACYHVKTPKPARNRVSRFTLDKKNPLRADPDSETIILEWPSDGHNGGYMAFGPDGYLYIAAGDGSGIADEYNTGQFLGDLLSSILRIDVDKADSGKLYAVPPDNPFVAHADIRHEIWAYGLRQPWKFNFDPANGDLWAGEVGQDLWEMIYLIKKGGNYGWSATEGRHVFRPNRKLLGPSPLEPPIVELPHSDFRSITTGFIHRGKRLAELNGALIYGDYDTGKIWAMRYDRAAKKVTFNQELVDTSLRVVAFGEDHAGEITIVDYQGGLYRLIPAPPTPPTAAPFPRKLSETGLFVSTKDHTSQPGLFAYSVNAALWSDHADKERFIAVPGDGKIKFDANDGWEFPEGTVLVKTFSLELERGNPASKRRLETRLLHLEQNHWRGYTYLWNDDQSDAELAPASGVDRKLSIKDAKAPGGVREQTWRFPSRTECALCHTFPPKFGLGTNAAQMNREGVYDGVRVNQIDRLHQLGMLESRGDIPTDFLPKLADPFDAKAKLDDRARGYLHANCAHCHVKWGGGQGDFQLKYHLSPADTGIINVEPSHGRFDVADARLIAPGAPQRSLILNRMSRTGLGRMPHVASNVVDERAVELIREWIAKMPAGGR